MPYDGRVVNVPDGPALTAMICDGLGWFTSLDFKRALLVFEGIHYLLPEDTLAFRDIDGAERWLMFPQWLYGSKTFSVKHSSIDLEISGRLAECALADGKDPAFRA